MRHGDVSVALEMLVSTRVVGAGEKYSAASRNVRWDRVTHPGFPEGGRQRQAWAAGLVRFDGESVNSSSQRPGTN